MLIHAENLTFGYDDTPILSNLSFTVNEGDKIGLIGANGEGKTTLIRLILGEKEADAGKITLKNGIRIGYLEQNADYSSDATVFEEMKKIFAEDEKAIESVNALSEEMALLDEGSEEFRSLSARYEYLHKFILSRDSYHTDVRIKTVLNGMGFEGFYEQKISTMSGGEKTRLKLCRLLLENPEILILDEPTNHLDMKTLFWLEDYLSSFSGALFLVSHDRYFLDKLTEKIFELEFKTLSVFSGNYSKYKILKAEKVALLQKEYEKQQVEIAHMQDFIDRNRYKATKAKSAQSRIKTLQKMELIEKPHLPPRPPRFFFSYDERPYERVLEINHLCLSAGEKTLLPDASLLVKRGEKCALLGDNGTGKSTLLKEIVKGNPAVSTARFVKMAYYDQENLNLDPENTVLGELWSRHSSASQTEIRAILAEAKLEAEDMDKKVKFLSGGERAKLALAVFETERGNFLLLDEPTNHLDLPARESLESALKEFDGTVLFVSHDRYFIAALATKIAYLADGTLTEFSGSYEEFRAEQKRLSDEKAARESLQAAELLKKQKAESDSSHRSKAERAADAKKKQRVKEIETEITALEEEEALLTEEISRPEIAADYLLLGQKCARIEEIHARTETLLEEYETLL